MATRMLFEVPNSANSVWPIETGWSPLIPELRTSVWLAPTLAAWILGWGALAGLLKRRGGWRTGDTRKLFHFAIFSAATELGATLGMPAVNLLGGLTLLYVLAAVWRGAGDLLYEALAREGDAPRRALHVVVPLIATAAGGILSAALFGPAAIVGMAVGGWGDAVGEPVGIRFGRRRFRVPTLGGVAATRSLEGCAAVLAASFAAGLIVLLATPLGEGRSAAAVVGVALTVALAATAVEAVSPHGLDNLTIQVAASAVAWMLTQVQ